jgi:hypothetical protein
MKSFRTTSLIAVFLLSPVLSIGQVTVEWSNDPGGVALAVDQQHDVYSAAWDYNPAGDISLTKRNPSGDILWTATYDNTDDTRHEVANWIQTDSQNNCLVAGTIRSGFSNPVNAASVLMKFDTAGNLIWRTVFESTFEGSYTKKILVDSADNTYVLGLGMGNSGLVTRIKKFSPGGVPIWTFYDPIGIGAPINFKFTPDNALIVAARGVTGIVNGFLKLGTDGNLIWSKTGITSATVGDVSGDTAGNTYTINGQNTIVNAGSIIEKWDSGGNLVWSQTHTMAGNKIEVGNDNNPIISGFPSSGGAGAAFMKYDSDGNVIWQNLNADGPEMLLLHGQLLLDALNNAYLSAGNLFNMAVCKVNANGSNGWVGLVSGSNSAQSFVLDSDYSVYITATTTAKLSETVLAINANSTANLRVTPNPFDNQFTVVTPDRVGLKTLTLHTINGIKMYENTFTGSAKRIDLPNIESGLYVLTVTGQDGLVSRQKMVKQ